MFGIAVLVLPILGASAVYIDATERNTQSPLWWAIFTLVIGYATGPIILALFLLIYLVLHVIEEYWKRRSTTTP